MDSYKSWFAETSLFAFPATWFVRDWARFFAPTAAVCEHFVTIFVTLMTLFLRHTFAVGQPDEAWATETATFTLVAALFARRRASLSALTAALREELVLSVTLLAAIGFHAMAVHSVKSWFAEATLLAPLIANSAWKRTGFHALVATVS